MWLRKMKGIPLLCVNTTHLVAAYDVLLPESLSKSELVQAGVLMTFTRPYERLFSRIYNQSDGLVVLSEGLRTYWRERGVTAPIHVIPRTVQPEVFDKPLGPDPVHAPHRPRGPAAARPAAHLPGRHTREKSQDRIIRIFAQHVLPQEPDATLSLVGEGPDTEVYAAWLVTSARSTASSSRARSRGRRCRISTGMPICSFTLRSARPTAT